MLYLISYDLAKPKKDYPPLIKALEKARAVRVLYSEWLLASDEDAEAIHAAIRQAGQLDNDDSLFVAELAADAVWDKGRLRATMPSFRSFSQTLDVDERPEDPGRSRETAPAALLYDPL